MTRSKIKFLPFKVCVIGPGVVGQATGKVLSEKGHQVVFWGRGQGKISRLCKEGFKAYTLAQMQEMPYDHDITILTVPTPTVAGKIDLSFLDSVAVELGKRLRNINKYHVVIVKSTVPPGTTERIVKIVESYSGRKAGRDFGASMNPEFLREKSAYQDFLESRLVVIGELDKKSGDVVSRLYKNFDCPIVRVSLKEAEMQKYVHNLFNATKITFFNEMRSVCQKIGVDAERIFPAVAQSAEGMWNPRYGIRNLGPFDGMCLPKDMQAFLDWARNLKLNVPLLESVLVANESFTRKKGVKPHQISANGETQISLKKEILSAQEYDL